MKLTLLSNSFAVALLLCGCATPQNQKPTSPTLITNPQLEDGAPFIVRVQGLRRGERVRLHGLRTLGKWVRSDDGQWRQVDVSMHAWGDFVADRRGRVNVSSSAPVAGTWRSPTSEALFWSGYREGAPELREVTATIASLPKPSGGSLSLALTRGDEVLATSKVDLITPKNLTTLNVRETGLVGAYAAPKDGRNLPVIVLLHGSEGGKLDSARADAARFAAQGYAVLAISYFSYPWEAIPGTPNAHVNIELETIARARDWLARQQGTNVSRFGVYGVSKGAEFAALAAATFPWIDAVVPCVGSDVVWEGYGIEPRPNPYPSSWSKGGEPLPAIELIPYVENSPQFQTNTQRYTTSRNQSTLERVAAARIPIETGSARFLFIGGDRDEVWASGDMSRSLFDNLKRAGRANGSQVVTYPLAGHNICGSGLFPTRLYEDQGTGPLEPNLTASGEATVDAWNKTKAFFKSALR
jgi:BAAT / Acyl-CoA thioester hydrolase C terminal/Acyl-CoA thioester hydrolase/BAAT N-terminal region